jgi:hypothetical protein
VRIRAGKTSVLLAAGAALFAAAVCGVVWIATTPRDRTLEVTVRDAVSHSWVWDLTATLDGRVVRRFYQSDRGPVALEFSRLPRGTGVLELSAPSYVPMRVPVTVRGRRTVLDEPLDMVGYEIADLAEFLVFQAPARDGYVAELRPVRSDGTAATNHPCLDLWVGCMVWVQTKGGAPVTAPTETGSERGQLLFRDRLQWTWDSSPDVSFRYRAPIPRASMLATQAPYLVFDYLIVVPDARRVTPAELSALMKSVWSTAEPADALRLLDQNRDRLSYFFDTSWNVERSP